MANDEVDLELAMLELDDIYKELKEMKVDPGKANGLYQASTTPRNYGRQRIASLSETSRSRDVAFVSANYSTTSRIDQRRKSLEEQARGPGVDNPRLTKTPRYVSASSLLSRTQSNALPAMTSQSSHWGASSCREMDVVDSALPTTSDGFGLPLPPIEPPPPPIIPPSNATRHTDSDYDEVPDEDESARPITKATFDDGIPDYDEIPDELENEETGQYVAMETLPYPKDHNSKARPGAAYARVDKTRGVNHVDETVTTQTRFEMPNNDRSFYDNVSNAVQETSFDGRPANGVANHVTTKKTSVLTLREGTDDEWDDDSGDDAAANATANGMGKNSSNLARQKVVFAPVEDDQIIDCTEKPRRHKAGEHMWCQFMMSLSVVFLIALFITLAILFVYFGLQQNLKPNGSPPMTSPNGTATGG